MNGLIRGSLTSIGFFLSLIAIGGCSTTEKSAKPEYHRPLDTGQQALRKVGPAEVRSHLVTAYDRRDVGPGVVVFSDGPHGRLGVSGRAC